MEVTVSKVDVEKLRRALQSCEEAMGPGSDTCILIRTQLQQEMDLRKKATPPHQQLLRVQRKIVANDAKLQKMDGLRELADQALLTAQQNLEKVQSQGRALQAVQTELEEEQQAILASLQGPQQASGQAPCFETKGMGLAEQMAALLSAAAQHVDSGDERAQQLGVALGLAAKQMEIYLQTTSTAAVQVTTNSVQLPTVTSKATEGRGSSTPLSRVSSRSPRRSEASIEATAAAAMAAKLLASSQAEL